VLTLDAFSQFHTVYDGPRGPLSWPGWGSDPNQAMIDEFVGVCAGTASPRVTGTDGHVATRIALAAIESARTGRPVQLTGEPAS
jgi:predicted dehydrogenase